ncbi:hypothetical protein Droror1_Dr00027952 [Drosera rotundifolia]
MSMSKNPPAGNFSHHIQFNIPIKIKREHICRIPQHRAKTELPAGITQTTKQSSSKNPKPSPSATESPHQANTNPSSVATTHPPTPLLNHHTSSSNTTQSTGNQNPKTSHCFASNHHEPPRHRHQQ